MPASMQRTRRRALARTILPAALALVLASSGLVTATTTPAAAATTVSAQGTALRFALYQLGHPYRFGGAGPSAWDCSGLTMAAFRSAGYVLPHSSRAQYSYGTRVYRTSWRPGDLIFWSRNGTQAGIYHVGLYAGAGMVLHAPSSGRVVQVERISAPGLLPYGRRIGATGLLTISPGATGDKVKALQLRLRANRLPVAVTGVYDRNTLIATKRFQRAAGQPVDGVVRTGTWWTLVTYGSQTYVR